MKYSIKRHDRTSELVNKMLNSELLSDKIEAQIELTGVEDYSGLDAEDLITAHREHSNRYSACF